MGLFNFFKKKNNSEIQEKIVSPQSTPTNHNSKFKDVVNELEHLGYFKYASTSDIDDLKDEVENSLLNYCLSTLMNDETNISKDFRHYFLDNEDLFKEGGFNDAFKELEPLFKMMDFKLDITNHIEDYDNENEWVNHSMTINGKDYIIFKDFQGYGWGESAKKFAEILNDQLIIQNKDERIFLAGGGNDGRFVVLTEAQFDLLDPLLRDLNDRPLRIKDWSQVMMEN